MQELQATFEDRTLSAIDADIAKISESYEDESYEENLSKLVEERITAEEHEEEVEKAVSELGLDGYRDTLVRELSGGWQMRVALGKIFLSKPDLILLDEPTNHVDLETVEFMERLLAQQECAMVVVSHDRYFLNQVCNRIVEIADGAASTYFGNYVAYLESRDAHFASQWRRYNLYRDNVKRLKKKIARLEQRFLLDTLAQKKKAFQCLYLSISEIFWKSF